MAITLDFTGLFYELKVDVAELDSFQSPQPRTVKKLTEFAVNKLGDTGGTLIYAKFSPGGFLSAAYVEHRSNPRTRQKDPAGNPSPSMALPTGIYGFDDAVRTNRVTGVQISFSLSWQYYIFRGRELISGVSATSTDRKIIPAEISNSATPLEDNDIVRWKLVAIGGLQELVETGFASMSAERRLAFMARAATEGLTVRDVASRSLEDLR
jgi:hypothetical protein